MSVILAYPTSLDILRNGTRISPVLRERIARESIFGQGSFEPWLPAYVGSFERGSAGPVAECIHPDPNGPASRVTPARELHRVRSTLVQLGLINKDDVITTLVTHKSARTKSAGATSLIWSRPILSGWIMPLVADGMAIPGIFICSPTFLFIQAAMTGMETGALEALACELCGSYRRQLARSSELLRNFMPTAHVRHEQPLPLVSQQQMLYELEHAPLHGCRGIRNAKTAALRAVEGAASTLEALCGALMALPRQHGGAGLPKPTMNAPFLLNGHGQALLGIEQVHLDLAFYARNAQGDECPVAEIEVLGKSTHGGDGDFTAVERDAMRNAAVLASGCVPLSLSSAQIKRFKDFDAVAMRVARLLGNRKYPQTDIAYHKRAAFIKNWLADRDVNPTPWAA